MENRSGLVVDACLTAADGHCERIAALTRRTGGRTTGGNSGERSAQGQQRSQEAEGR
jgi:uncharacterized membrane protein